MYAFIVPSFFSLLINCHDFVVDVDNVQHRQLVHALRPDITVLVDWA